jgi:peptidylprolyl isomerase
MPKKIYLFLTVLTVFFSSCKDEHKNLKDGLYAEIETSKGTIILELEYKKVPVTVANFVTLAEGNNPFVSEDLKGVPFYDGLKFHRVIPDFMIQTGDPLGNGSGDAGYTFSDEITDLKHDKAGVLSMANSGPGTNSSQFFITHLETPWLDGKHTVFGHVVEGQDVVNSIAQDDMMKTVRIIRKGEEVKKFDAVKTFTDFFKKDIENQKNKAAIDAENIEKYNAKFDAIKKQKVLFLANLKKSATKSSTGLSYIITKKTNGKKPENGTTIHVNYSGFLEDGTLFDSSIANVAKQFGTYDEQRAAQNGYSALPYEIGSNRMIPGFIEGLNKMKIGEKAVFFIPANLGYGAQGAGNVIPPNANLIFEVELIN